MTKNIDSRESLWQRLGAGSGTPTDRANNRRFNHMSIVWALSLIAASAVIGGLELPAALQWLVALAPNIFGFLALSRYLQVLRMTDELQRRIHLEGLAVGFGTGYFFAMGYLLAEAAGAPPLNPALVVVVMTAGWIFGNYRAVRHYQ